jgi:hypothetical protein
MIRGKHRGKRTTEADTGWAASTQPEDSMQPVIPIIQTWGVKDHLR